MMSWGWEIILRFYSAVIECIRYWTEVGSLWMKWWMSEGWFLKGFAFYSEYYGIHGIFQVAVVVWWGNAHLSSQLLFSHGSLNLSCYVLYICLCMYIKWWVWVVVSGPGGNKIFHTLVVDSSSRSLMSWKAWIILSPFSCCPVTWSDHHLILSFWWNRLSSFSGVYFLYNHAQNIRLTLFLLCNWLYWHMCLPVWLPIGRTDERHTKTNSILVYIKFNRRRGCICIGWMGRQRRAQSCCTYVHLQFIIYVHEEYIEDMCKCSRIFSYIIHFLCSICSCRLMCAFFLTSILPVE